MVGLSLFQAALAESCPPPTLHARLPRATLTSRLAIAARREFVAQVVPTPVRSWLAFLTLIRVDLEAQHL
jgi:hypothetical protein